MNSPKHITSLRFHSLDFGRNNRVYGTHNNISHIHNISPGYHYIGSGHHYASSSINNISLSGYFVGLAVHNGMSAGNNVSSAHHYERLVHNNVISSDKNDISSGNFSKYDMRKLMMALTLVIISKIRPYAKRVKNNELLVAIDYSETELSQVKEDTCVKRCVTVLTKGRELLVTLKDYNLTEGELVALEAAIEPFEDLNEKRDVTLGERMSATQKLEQLLPLLRAELTILDDLVKGQMPEDFQSDYKNIR